MLNVIPNGTKVKIGIDFTIYAEIEAICIRGNNITYQVFWFDNCNRKSDWLPENQFQIVKQAINMTKIGFEYKTK